MKKRKMVRNLASLLLLSMVAGLMPAPSWLGLGEMTAAAAERAVSAAVNTVQLASEALTIAALGAASTQGQEEQTWWQTANGTQTPQYHTFNDAQVLEAQEETGQKKGGTAGAYISLQDVEPIFNTAQGKMTFKWTDNLSAWIAAQPGDPVTAPAGYTITLKLKDIKNGTSYPLLDNVVDHSGLNQYEWNGKDSQGKPLPDGYYYIMLSAESGSVTFNIPAADPGDPPTAAPVAIPAYQGQFIHIVVDRSAPELIALHPLGGGKIAVEARDEVGGLKQIEWSVGTQTGKRTFSSAPIQMAYAFAPGDGGELTVKLTDISGNLSTETQPLQPLIPGGGDQSYRPQAEAAIAGSPMTINLDTGNGNQVFHGFSQKGPGVDLDIDFTYNHQNRVKGMLGYGWSFSLDSRLKKWPDGDITWVGFDGTTYWFKEENGTYVSYADGQQTVYPKLTLRPERLKSTRPGCFYYGMVGPAALPF